MKLMKRSAALILALALSLALCACGGDRAEIKRTLNNFESACQSLDLNEILDCVKPSVADPIRTGASLVGSLTGQSSAELLDSIVPALFGEDYGSSAFLNSIKIKVESIAVTDNAATAMCTVSYLRSEETVERDATFRLVKEGDKESQAWYIEDIDFN